MLLSFLLFGCVSTMSVAYQRSSWISPAKVRKKCHRFVTASVLYNRVLGTIIRSINDYEPSIDDFTLSACQDIIEAYIAEDQSKCGNPTVKVELFSISPYCPQIRSCTPRFTSREICTVVVYAVRLFLPAPTDHLLPGLPESALPSDRPPNA